MPKNNPEEFEYHCTECGAKVKASDKVCPKCKADLSEEVDDTNIKMVTADTFENEFEAKIAQKKLLSAKIESFISADNAGGTRPGLSYVSGVKLMVKETDYIRAEKVLSDKRTKEEYYETKCHFCGADVTLTKKEYDAGKYICPGCFKSNWLE